jgi:hypothetical protein
MVENLNKNVTQEKTPNFRPRQLAQAAMMVKPPKVSETAPIVELAAADESQNPPEAGVVVGENFVPEMVNLVDDEDVENDQVQDEAEQVQNEAQNQPTSPEGLQMPQLQLEHDNSNSPAPNLVIASPASNETSPPARDEGDNSGSPEGGASMEEGQVSSGEDDVIVF